MKVFEDVGVGTSRFLEYIGGVAILLADSSFFLARLKIRFVETINQAYLLGVQSWSIVLLTSATTGAVFSLESALQAVKYGVGSLLGGVVSYTTVRELGPLLSAVVVAGRTGAAIAAELGSMVVTEQIDALRSLGLSPVRMLVVPRLLALLVMLPLLAMLADLVSVIGGMMIAQSMAHISYDSFIASARQTVHFVDILKGLFKSVIFALIIVLIGSYQGLATRGGAAGVGKATTGAVVISIILIFFFNFFLSYVLFQTG